MSLLAINVSVQYNGGFLPDNHTVDPMLLPSRNSIKSHEEFFFVFAVYDPTY